MPRAIEEILAHADELAARLESYQPDPEHELDAKAVSLLRAAVTERSAAERRLGLEWRVWLAAPCRAHRHDRSAAWSAATR